MFPGKLGPLYLEPFVLCSMLKPRTLPSESLSQGDGTFSGWGIKQSIQQYRRQHREHLFSLCAVVLVHPEKKPHSVKQRSLLLWRLSPKYVYHLPLKRNLTMEPSASNRDSEFANVCLLIPLGHGVFLLGRIH